MYKNIKDIKLKYVTNYLIILDQIYDTLKLLYSHINQLYKYYFKTHCLLVL